MNDQDDISEKEKFRAARYFSLCNHLSRERTIRLFGFLILTLRYEIGAFPCGQHVAFTQGAFCYAASH